MQAIDDWFQTRRLGLVLETKVGAGQLLVTRLLHYISGPEFRPLAELTPAQVRNLIK